MSLGRRLLNLARAELYDAARRIVKDHPTRHHDGASWSLEDDPTQSNDARTNDPPSREAPVVTPEEDRIRRYYANLELPFGAPREAVKTAYRRLVREYHPDRHHNNEGRQATATKLLLELRKAYEALLAYLDDTPPDPR
ncbi:MAG: J domain-containing protein [Deltaproteobacteria bacterium]|nr:J domain-containing protein [Deltaproteobacteria bacterium]